MEQNNRTTYDIAVIGAGPAGTMFAKEIAKLRPNLKIALIDGQTADSAKPCGGLWRRMHRSCWRDLI